MVVTVQKRINELYAKIVQGSKLKNHNKVRRYSDDDQTSYDHMAAKRSVSPDTKSNTDKLTEKLLQIGETRIDGVEKALNENQTLPKEDKEIIKHDVENDHRCTFLTGPGDTSSFFGVSRQDTQIVVTFYSDHKMYDRTIKIFDDILSGENVDNKEAALIRAYNAMKLIFLSWARMEDEDPDPESKKRYRKIREKWGDILSDCYDDD